MAGFRRAFGRRLSAIAILGAVMLAGTVQAQSPSPPQTILFVGNSFTFGAYSAVWHYRPETVTDLNNTRVGGVPALFKLFAKEAGLDYQVSLVTNPGVGLDYHWAHNLQKIDATWDHVILQSFSTLDAAKPGDPGLLIDYTRRFSKLLHAKNPKVDIRLDATWSRPDKTYPADAPPPWRGRSIFSMADDLERGYEAAAKTPSVNGVIPVGEAFSDAIRAGVADPNPYDGIGFGQVDLWAFDHYHASAFGYYLEALMIFGAVTGRDPASLGPLETAAGELGISPLQAEALQKVAHDALTSSTGVRSAYPR